MPDLDLTKKPIEAGWKSYRKLVIPKEATDVQIRECRQAFYAGAAILFKGIMGALDSESEPTDADMERMQRIQDELDEFGLQLDLRYLKTTGEH
jgi:hypothetical protein